MPMWRHLPPSPNIYRDDTTCTGKKTLADSMIGPKRDLIDAGLWFALSLVVLSNIQVGAVTGDGLVRSTLYEQGTWGWNPNRLLMDPAGAIWHHLMKAFGSVRTGTDQQRLLSIWAGATALGLFRWRLAPLVTLNRISANHATTWFVLGSAFSRLWISDKTPILQMPFLVIAAASLVRYSTQPKAWSAISAGLALGVATLFFISNIILATTLSISIGLWHSLRREPRQAIVAFTGVYGTAVALAGVVLFLVWLLDPTSAGEFIAWLTNYAGGTVSERTMDSYGISLSPMGIVTASAHALYGAGSAVVNMSPAVEFWRDKSGSLLRAILTLAAGASAGSAILLILKQRQDRSDLPVLLSPACIYWIMIAWSGAVLVFGVLWNDSDDQFYMQLAVPLGIIMAGLPDRSRSRIILLGACALALNIFDGIVNYIMYPREERIIIVENIIEEANLLIYPGYDEIDNLLFFTNTLPPERRISVTYLALQKNSIEGLEFIDRQIRETITQGGDVAVVSIYDVPPDQSPWKYVRRLGYSREEIISLLNTFEIDTESQKTGPFTIRWIRGDKVAEPISWRPADLERGS